MPITRASRRSSPVSGVTALTMASGLAILLLAGIAAAGESHPRTAASEGRIAHERLSSELWPQDALTALESEPSAMDRREGPLRIEVHVAETSAPLVERIRRHAVSVRSVSARHGRVNLEVADRDAAMRIADLDGVLMVERDWGAVRQTGAITSRAPRALNTIDLSHGTMLEGLGQKLGILSDSFARTDTLRTEDTEPEAGASTDNGPVTLEGLANQISGDLPAEIELFADDAASPLSDEGAAMGELAYDIAPAIDIAFHTAFVSQADFARGFATLCSADGADADVVVDDVLYLNEPMYQPGIVAQAASACVDDGVAVFSAAGNAGGSGYREVYVDIDPAAEGSFGDDFHAWDTNQPLLPIQLGAGESIRAVLQWNQPWTTLKPEGTARAPQVDLDLYLFDGADPATASIVASNFRDQRADSATSGADPWEIISFEAPRDGTWYLAVDHFAGSKTTIPQDDGTDLEFRLVFFASPGIETDGPGIEIDGKSVPPGPEGPTLYGHAAAEGVIAVGAIPWWTIPPAFDPTLDDSPTDGIDPQAFSARGGELPLTFDGDSGFVGRTLPLAPQIAAVDGNRNTFFGQVFEGGEDGEEPPTTQDDADEDEFWFFGTSAAAPNAAAVATLLTQHVDDLAPAALQRALTSTAIDVDGERAAPGPDAVSGFGLIDGDAAVNTAFPIAVAGRDRNIEPGATVVLDGGDSSGGTRQLTNFAWLQTEGEAVTLTDAGSAEASFTAPDNVGAVLAFELTVMDELDVTDSDTVRLTVTEPQADDLLENTSSKSGKSGSSGCFIATAAHGSALAPEVEHLRAFRDRYLVATLPGRLVTAAYYRLSPPLADWLRVRPRARSVVRAGLAPVVVAAAHPVLTGSALLLVIGGLCVRRSRRAPRVRPAHGRHGADGRRTATGT